MAIDLAPPSPDGGAERQLRSDGFPGPSISHLDRRRRPWTIRPGRADVGPLRRRRRGRARPPSTGFDGTVAPPSRSAPASRRAPRLEVAVAARARRRRRPRSSSPLACQRAEQRASGVPCGVMDQLASLAGVAGHALLIDFRTLARRTGADARRTSRWSSSTRARSASWPTLGLRRAAAPARGGRADRRPAAGRRASATWPPSTTRSIRARGPPRRHRERPGARPSPTLVRAATSPRAGALMIEAHASFRDDFAASTPVVDALVDRLVASPGVHGARLTGGGFGGCVVALVDPGTPRPSGWGRHWRGAGLRPGAAAALNRRQRREGARPADRTAVGVRTPHQNRSWPSTSTTGATDSSSATCRSRERIGLARRQHQVGRRPRPPRPGRSRGSGLAASANDVVDAERAEQRRRRRCRPLSVIHGPTPDRARTPRAASAPRTGGGSARAGGAPTPTASASAAKPAFDVVERLDPERTCTREAGRDERVGVLPPVLLVAHHDEVGRRARRSRRRRILRAADVRQRRAARRTG